MKSFKETFSLINSRIRNLNGMIKSVEYCIENNINVEYNRIEFQKYITELNALILQDSQLRNFIIKDDK